ncbi:MAG: head GIN domain-containing protein [Gilvibacter sp.]
MKKFVFYILAFLLLLGCDGPNANDCFQAQGNSISETVQVAPFSKITFGDGIRLVLKQGEEQSVVIETGENLLPEILVSVSDQTLSVTDENACNLVRDYGVTTIFVTAPDITQIRNASRWEIRSNGVLSYPNLTLLSNTNPEQKSGDFYLTLDTENLKVVANGVSVFYLEGTAVDANIIFSDEQPRFEGALLNINHLMVLQRSANDMIVNPLESISGEIRGVGNIVVKNRPPIVDVEQFFTGRLIFDD